MNYQEVILELKYLTALIGNDGREGLKKVEQRKEQALKSPNGLDKDTEEELSALALWHRSEIILAFNITRLTKELRERFEQE